MLVAYCRECLPEKVVIGFGERRADFDVPHDIHKPLMRNGLLGISYKEWQTIEVKDGNGAVDEAATKASIADKCGDRMVK